MERFRRNVSPPDRARQGLLVGGEASRGRKSIGRAAESFLASIKSVRRKGDDDGAKTSPFFAAFFRLPNELHIHILSHLSISDLLSLRRTSHALHDLIATCDAPLVRFWVKRRLGTLHLTLYPAPAPHDAHLHYLLAMRRRHIASVRLTRQLANVVLKDNNNNNNNNTRKHTSERQRQLWTSVYEKMMPLVFAVGYFLDEHRKVILERDLGRIRPRHHIGYDICTTPAMAEEERAIFKRLDQPLRLPYFYMYCFILQVLTRKLRPPAYAGSGGRQAACDEDIAFVLVLGGISQVAKLLACNPYSERRRLLHRFITRLSPHLCVGWRSHWRDLGVSSPALLDDIPCTSIGITQLDQIWEPLMAELMRPESREYTEQQKARYAEVRASRAYINEIMGYDILRGRPAEGDGSDGEEEEV